MPGAGRSPAPVADAAGLEGVLHSVEVYYSETIRRHGATPRGVDWESLATQQMRFVQLLKICDWGRPLSLNDLGCGYGALLALLADRHADTPIDYLGVDLSPRMIAAARRLWKARASTRFAVGSACPRVADYSVASGIFNVKLDQPADRWERFVRETIRQLFATSRVGFAVNFILDSGESPFAEELFCTQPKPWIAFCRETLGATVQVLDDYGMQEFTMLVRRS